MVSLRTPTFAANSSCFISNLALYSFILFLIIGYTTSIFPIKASSNNAKDNDRSSKPKTNAFCQCNIRIIFNDCIITRNDRGYCQIRKKSPRCCFSHIVNEHFICLHKEIFKEQRKPQKREIHRVMCPKSQQTNEREEAQESISPFHMRLLFCGVFRTSCYKYTTYYLASQG